jgi:CelD/BcsL family acetyltransferase involved in cellulose biosynthesis
MTASCIQAPATPGLRGSWIATAAEFAQLEREWCDLFTRANCENTFITFAWMSTWWKHFGIGQLAIVAVREAGGRLVGLAPFYIAHTRAALGARRLGFLADNHVGSDYLDILADPNFGQAAVETIVRILRRHQRRWDYIELRDAADSPLLASLSSQLENGGMQSDRVPGQLCYYIPLPSAFEQYLSGIGIGLRANFRRRWRNLQREHQGECLALSRADELEQYFPSLIALHRMRFQQREVESAFLAPGVPEFHVDAMRSLAAQGVARMFVLRGAGEDLAAIYGFASGKTFQFYQCGMHTEWMRHGVGQVLIGKAIEQAIGAGCTVFDFLRGGESYKAQWADHSRQTTTWRFFDNRRGSLAARLSLQATAAARRIARNARTRLREWRHGAKTEA